MDFPMEIMFLFCSSYFERLSAVQFSKYCGVE
jgi:hypothetical protein